MNPLQPVVQAIKAGDKASARTMLKDILQDDPSPEAWLLVARVSKTPEQAIKAVQKALKLDPNHAQARKMLTRLQAESAASKAPPTDRPQSTATPRPTPESKPTLQFIDQNDPDALVQAALQTDNRQQAIALVRQALQVDEWHSDANRLLSQLESPRSLKQLQNAWGDNSIRSMEDLKRSGRISDEQVQLIRRRQTQQIIWSALLFMAFVGSLLALRAFGVLEI